ncbi:hypothetical protein RJ639_011263 [Escallonia herrerae]|uniref:MADS-box domain-containing protein n=1 Tax=Escallonia herrerae TaxID=1293975 RepID=A0AA88VV28_9ASTE|nr:hypothetical protein RJ639_011263 [Escallonia herrerae]
MPRRSKGRQRVAMQKMANSSNLQVTFSKRRNGVFKKASELCTLCDAQAAIIVFSPGGKAYSFGHPHVDYVIDKFLTRNPPPNDGTLQFIEARRASTIRDLNSRLSHLQSMYEDERRHGEALQRIWKEKQRLNWWDAPIEELSMEQLEQLKAALKIVNGGTNQKLHSQMFKPASGGVPYDPTTIGSSGNAPYDPMDAGSSKNAPYEHMPYVQYDARNVGCSMNFPVDHATILPFNSMTAASSMSVPSNPTPIVPIVPYNSTVAGTGMSVTYEHRTAGSSNGILHNDTTAFGMVVPINSMDVVSHRNAPYNPMADGPNRVTQVDPMATPHNFAAAGSSKNVPLNPMAAGPSMSVGRLNPMAAETSRGVSYDSRTPGFGGGAHVHARAPELSASLPFNHGATGFHAGNVPSGVTSTRYTSDAHFSALAMGPNNAISFDGTRVGQSTDGFSLAATAGGTSLPGGSMVSHGFNGGYHRRF